MADNYETYKLGDFKLKNGGEISGAFIAYKTLGDPSLPAIIYPSWYSGCKFLLYLSYIGPLLTEYSNCRQSLACRRRQDTQSVQLLHHHPSFVWQWPVFFAFEHAE